MSGKLSYISEAPFSTTFSLEEPPIHPSTPEQKEECERFHSGNFCVRESGGRAYCLKCGREWEVSPRSHFVMRSK